MRGLPGTARQRHESGQAAVEAAILLPLYVFLLLGILQLGLMHQARLLTKYAAYKAVRAGALHHASMRQMERAALAVLLPLVSRDTGGGEHIQPTQGAEAFTAKWRWSQVRDNTMSEGPVPYVQVTVCGPLSEDLPAGVREVNFDAPGHATHGDWRKGQRTKLRVQVTFNYRMPIPFANQVIFAAARNHELPWVMRMGRPEGPRRSFRDARGEDPSLALAEQGIYIQPIRATYTMRMHSNFLPQKPGHTLPEQNRCIFPFQYD